MSILILNLSLCRLRTSALLERLMQEQLGEQTQLWSRLDIETAWGNFLEVARLADIWIFITPCYVSVISGDTTEISVRLYQTELLGNKYVYAAAQGGVSYTHTHHYYIGNVKLFTKAMQLCWMGDLVVGGEAIIDRITLRCLPNAVLMEHCLQRLTACIRYKTEVVSLLPKQAGVKVLGLMARLMCLKMNYTVHKQ